MIYKNLFLILCASFLFTGCEKDKHDEASTAYEHKYCIAGNFIGDSVILKCFSPVKEVKGYRKGTSENYTYLDSVLLDLNNDGNNDVKFRYFEKLVTHDCPTPTDPNIVVDCFPDFSLSGDIEPLSNVEIAYTEIKYPLALTQAQRFMQGDTINNHELWTKKKIQMIEVMQCSYPFNIWSIDDYLSFVGIRFIERQDTIYGWIRVNTARNSKFLISDYALVVK